MILEMASTAELCSLQAIFNASLNILSEHIMCMYGPILHLLGKLQSSKETKQLLANLIKKLVKIILEQN